MCKVTHCTSEDVSCIDAINKKNDNLECQIAKLTSLVDSTFLKDSTPYDNDNKVESELQTLSGSVAVLTEKISCDVPTSSSDQPLNYAEALKLSAAPVAMTKREKAKPKEIVYLKPDNLSADKPLLRQHKQKCLTEALSSGEVCFMKENDETGLISLGLPSSASKDKATKIMRKFDLGYSLDKCFC